MASTFLSSQEIVDAVDAGEIRIAYYAIEKDNAIVTLPEIRFAKPKPNDSDDDIDIHVRKEFFKSLEPDSFRFHMGPYAKVEELRRGELKKFIFVRGKEYVFNVKEAGKLIIYPQEFVLLGTNEYIEVSESIGASLCTNVRNTDIGLSHISTLIDPSWRGILQIGITNPTNYSKQLAFMDAICILRFHRLEGYPRMDIIDKFRSTRPHFGNNWWDIEKEKGRSFFPIRMEYSHGGDFYRRIAIERTIQQVLQVGKYIGVGALFAGAVSLFDLYNKMNKLDAQNEKILNIEHRLNDIEKIDENFHLLQSGQHKAIFTDNVRVVEFSISFSNPSATIPFVQVLIDADTVTKEITYSRLYDQGRDLYNAAIVRIRYNGPINTKEKVVMARWLLVNLSKSEAIK